MEDQIMFAEIINGVTVEMEKDPLAIIVGDTGLFFVTPKSNTSTYSKLKFEVADLDALKAYNITF